VSFCFLKAMNEKWDLIFFIKDYIISIKIL